MTLCIVADENMPNVEAWFSPIAKSIERKPGRNLTSADLREVDVLLVRSVTKVTKDLLLNTPVKFVGSATIGTDHIDRDYLQQQHIPFHFAPGCNAQSVTDWLMAVMARLHIDHDVNWWQKTIGVVGVGNVGSCVVTRLKSLGCRVMVCDPIKHDAGLLPEHMDMESLLNLCDIVCLHTPHTTSGPYPTDKMINAHSIAKMHAGSWLINAGRGPVIEGQALQANLASGHIQAVLDVWPEEPNVSSSLLDQVVLASPHVAGYSLEGKYKGTQMLAEALCQWANLELPEEVAAPAGFTLNAQLYQTEDLNQWVSEMVLAVYDPARDTATMRLSVEGEQITPHVFDQLRKEYPTRRELASIRIKNAPEELAVRLTAMGFLVV